MPAAKVRQLPLIPTDSKEYRRLYVANTYTKRHPEKVKLVRRVSMRTRARRMKLEVIEAYGGKCACCGVDNFEFLSIDHINGGGSASPKDQPQTTQGRDGLLRTSEKAKVAQRRISATLHELQYVARALRVLPPRKGELQFQAIRGLNP